MRELTIGDWEFARTVSEWIEILAIAVIALAVVLAFYRALMAVVGESDGDALTVFKNQIASGLLVGLDLLVAADIIRTVTLEQTLEEVASLGLLVLIRTFLNWTLVLEIEERWPWQRTSTPLGS